MKKLLFTTMGIFLINQAYAGDFSTDYSLNINNYYGYTDYAKPYNKMYKENNLNSSLNSYLRATYEANDEITMSLIGYFMVDSAKEVENYNQGIWGEEIYSLIETSLGDVSIGQDYNVAYKLAVGAPEVGTYKINNSDIVNFITNPNWYKKGHNASYKTLNSTYINTDGAAFKLNYITPSYKGIKLGATFVPDSYSQAGLVAKDSPYKNEEAYILGAYGEWDILGYELETSLGFAEYQKNDKEYSLGISVYRKGWTVGGSYRKTEDESKKYALNKENLYDAYRDGSAYNLGISYEIGPFKTGVAYFDSKSDKFSNHDKIISFSNAYQYNKYLNFSVTVAHLKSEGEDLNPKNNSKGYAFVLGLELSL